VGDLENLVNEEALVDWGLLRQKKVKKKTLLTLILDNTKILL
jgi:hypothetical protein